MVNLLGFINRKKYFWEGFYCNDKTEIHHIHFTAHLQLATVCTG